MINPQDLSPIQHRINGKITSGEPSVFKRLIRVVMRLISASLPTYGLAAVVLLGFALGARGSQTLNAHHQIASQSLADTMTSVGSSSLSRRIFSDSFSNDQFRGQVTADTSDGVISLRLELESSDDVSMIISFEGASCVLKSFSQTNPAQNTINSTNCALYLTHHGKNAYVFELKHVDPLGAWPFVYLQGNGAAYRRRVIPPGGEGC